MAKKWHTLLDNALASVYPALRAMSDNELRNVRSAPKKFSGVSPSYPRRALKSSPRSEA